MTVKVKKFDLETNYFNVKDELDKKEKIKIKKCLKDKETLIVKISKVTLQN